MNTLDSNITKKFASSTKRNVFIVLLLVICSGLVACSHTTSLKEVVESREQKKLVAVSVESVLAPDVCKIESHFDVHEVLNVRMLNTNAKEKGVVVAEQFCESVQ